jgi:hypothetical protein
VSLADEVGDDIETRLRGDVGRLARIELERVCLGEGFVIEVVGIDGGELAVL